jgi:TPR repeat protein
MHLKALAIAATLLALATPSWADFDEGKAAYDQGDYATALKEWRPLAEQGDASAQFHLGLMYGNGNGVARDSGVAMKLFRKAAEQGFLDAQYHLGFKYLFGMGVPANDAEAIKWLSKAAKQGHAGGEAGLGIIFATITYGLDRGKYEDVLPGLHSLAKHGHAEAQAKLGTLYDEGRGVPQDYVQAYIWFSASWLNLSKATQKEVAAENRDGVARKMTAIQMAEAEYKLGVMYHNGRGVPQDYAEAAKLYSNAAEQGLPIAQVALGYVYANGIGVTQDYVLAVMWSDLAARQDEEFAADNRRLYAKELTAAQEAEAQRLAREWLERHRNRKGKPFGSSSRPAVPDPSYDELRGSDR